MVIFRMAFAIFATTLLLGPGAAAQNTISVGSSFLASGDPLPQNCKDEAAVLRTELSSFQLLPRQWKWIVVCDDVSWQRLMQKRGRDGPRSGYGTGAESYNESVYASTEIDAHITILRGTNLLNPDNFLAQPGHVIAHELAHILLQTEDEDRAERQAILWLKQRRPDVVAAIPAAEGRQR